MASPRRGPTACPAVISVGPTCLLADYFGFGPPQFLGRKALFSKGLRFSQQFALDQGDLLRFGADVKGEKAGAESEEILGADVIGQTELVADAHEEARA